MRPARKGFVRPVDYLRWAKYLNFTTVNIVLVRLDGDNWLNLTRLSVSLYLVLVYVNDSLQLM